MASRRRTVSVQQSLRQQKCPRLHGAFLAAKRRLIAKPSRPLALFGLAGVALVIGGVLVGMYIRSLSPGRVQAPLPTPQVNEGAAAFAQFTKDQPIFAVMVENSADAWPLSGITEAPLAIEAPAEANIPRFIAFFSGDQQVEQIGPVRSARPYYVDWATELHALYAHVGGSPEALEILGERTTLQNFDEFYHGRFFWRSKNRFAPHNVYTSTDLLRQGATDVQWTSPEVSSWKFTLPTPLTALVPLSLTVDWTEGLTYDFTWKKDGDYFLRVPQHTDNPWQVQNLVVIETDISVIDNEGRKRVRTLGEGNALVWRVDGVPVEARWKKEAPDDRLRFYSAATGEEIALAPGKTWMGVVSDLARVHVEEN